jgi:denticleless
VLRPHENGTFDVRWSPSDTLLATCGADHTAAVSDPSREDAPPIHVLQGHGATLKCVAWANSSVAGTDAVLATGGRDGVVRVWDIRVAEACVATLSLRLPQDGAKTKGKGKKKVAPVPPRSVTSLLFPEEDAFALVGSSSSDG